jgi:hypothetical protein
VVRGWPGCTTVRHGQQQANLQCQHGLHLWLCTAAACFWSCRLLASSMQARALPAPGLAFLLLQHAAPVHHSRSSGSWGLGRVHLVCYASGNGWKPPGVRVGLAISLCRCC